MVVLLAVVTAALLAYRLDRQVRGYLAGAAVGSTRVFSAATVLRPGTPVSSGALVRRLLRTGYQRSEQTALAPGEYRTTKGGIEVSQRESPDPYGAAPARARILVRGDRVHALQDLDGNPLPALELEPELLAVVGGAGAALESGIEVVPQLCRAATLEAEDRHFYRHPGLDPAGIARALVANLRAGATRQGGSTITQQLAKNAFLSPDRTLARKAREAVLAVLLELRATKGEILGRYLASVYLGTDGGVPIHGFAHAAEVYFGKPVGELGAGECALLAGMIRAPNRYAPRRHPERARARRNHVLTAMARHGVIDAKAAARARAEPVRVAAPLVRSVGALYVADEVRRELEQVLRPHVAQAPGLMVFTGIDADAQREAERAVRRGLDALERRVPRATRRTKRLEAALVALDPRSGRVRALVGGRDYRSSPLDRAVRTRRQLGSTFKPFVYLTAVDPAASGPGGPLTVASSLDDAPLAVRVGAAVWRPANYDAAFRGPVAMRDALAYSLNTPTVRLALDVGVDAVCETAERLGLSTLPRVPAVALGAAEGSLLEVTAAYAVFANGGVRHASRFVDTVVSASGDVLYEAEDTSRRVVDPGPAYLVTHMLSAVVEYGTGRGARKAGMPRALAGKTGTTDDTRDAWFVGYTPHVVAGVWVGFDQGGATGFTGAGGALPIWTDFMRATRTAADPERFPVPADVVWARVDPTTGRLATPACADVRLEPFLAGTEPLRHCDHDGAVWAGAGEDVDEALRRGGHAVERGGHAVRRFFERLFSR
jgi:penicillin-binding protein 1B